MANLNGLYDHDDKPTSPFDPLPAGKYLAIIAESDFETTKSGSGRFLKLTLQIVEGEFKGRQLFDRLNLENANKQAVDIARSTLAAIRMATGVMSPRDSHELHNIPLCIKVKCKKREDTGEIGNEIAGYCSKHEATQASSLAPQASTKAPWQR